MKSKQTVQITLASIVAITLMTTGIVYANDDIMTEIEKAIKSLQQADKQHDKQFKKLNKQIKNLTSQIDDLQQENEKQQKQIKRLKEFRNNTRDDMQTMHSELNTAMNPIPTPENAIVTLTNQTIKRGDHLGFIVNIDTIPKSIPLDTEYITAWELDSNANATLDSVNIFINVDQEIARVQYQNPLFRGYDGFLWQIYTETMMKPTNQTSPTFGIHLEGDEGTGLHDIFIEIESEYVIVIDGDEFGVYADYLDRQQHLQYKIIP